MLKCDRDSRFDKIPIVRISPIELSMGGVAIPMRNYFPKNLNASSVPSFITAT